MPGAILTFIFKNKPSSDFLKTLAELEIDDELDLNELDLESSAESQSISSTETPNEQTNERKRNVFIIYDFKIYGPVSDFAVFVQNDAKFSSQPNHFPDKWCYWKSV